MSLKFTGKNYIENFSVTNLEMVIIKKTENFQFHVAVVRVNYIV